MPDPTPGTYVPEGTDLSRVHVLYRHIAGSWYLCDNAISREGIGVILERRRREHPKVRYAISLQSEIGPNRVRELACKVYDTHENNDNAE
jgi:hypothetical protein